MQLTPADLELSRTHPQSTELYLSIYKPRIVMSCLVSGSVPIGAMEITYKSVSTGTYLNVEEGMTLLAGTTPGGREQGKVRIRSATSTRFNVAENSDIDWENTTHLSVLRHWEIWPKYPRIFLNSNSVDVTFYKDYDIEYDAQLFTEGQNSILGAFPCAGTHRAGFVGDYLYYSSTGTVPLITGTTQTYSWTFEGGTPSTSTSGTPGNVQYNTAGHYATRLIVTNSNGATDTTYRYVSIYNRPGNSSENLPIQKWEIDTVSGSRDEGGYTANIKITDESIPSINDGDVVVIWSEDWYGNTKQSIGGNSPNNSKVFFVGHVKNNTIRYDYKSSVVEFQVASVTDTMKEAEGFAISVESKSEPSAWTELIDMDARRAIYHYLKWHSTVLSSTDFEFVGDDQKVQFFDSDRESLFDAIDNYMRTSLLGKLCADRQGKLWAEVGAYGSTNPTGTFPPIQSIIKRDWIGEPDIEERFIKPTSFIEMGGVSYDGSGFGAYLSQAPGNAPGTRGRVDNFTGLTVEGQAHLNEITGHMFANMNSQYPSIDLDLAGNYRQLDIAPQETVRMDISPVDTNRGITINSPYLIDSMTWKYDSKNKVMLPSAGLISLVNGRAGETVLIPEIPDEGGFDIGGGFGGFPSFPSAPSFPSPAPVVVEVLDDCNSLTFNKFPINWTPTLLIGNTATRIASAPFPCTLRQSSPTFKSFITLNAVYYGDASTKFSVFAVNNGVRVATAVRNNLGFWEFNLLSDLAVTGFEIELESGVGSITSGYGYGDIIETGDMGNNTTVCVTGNLYSIEAYTGYWATPWAPYVGQKYYNCYTHSGNSPANGGVGRSGIDGLFKLVYYGTGEETYAEQVDYNYGRIYYTAVGNTIVLKISGPPVSGNYYGMKWALRNAYVRGRMIQLATSYISNVCAP